MVDRIKIVGLSAVFDGMTWPRADNATGNLEWRLRHAPESITPANYCSLASIIAAYRELVRCPRTKREAVVRVLREVAERFPVEAI